MKAVWKYDVPVNDEECTIRIPIRSTIISVESRIPSIVSFWAIVNFQTKVDESRTFRIVGTGHKYPENWKYVGTAWDGPFVWHLMELIDE